MPTFPALIPSTRTYSPGQFPQSVHGVYDGSEARVRHSNTVFGVRLRLFFPAITSAELLTVIAHYTGQRGRFLPFAIPDELLSGVDTPADFTPAGHQWRYAAKPTAEDISVDGGTNLHNLTVELETVPPENTIVQGARFRTRVELRPGSAQLGQFFDVQATLDAGAAATQLEFTVLATFNPGSPFPVVNFDVTATLAAGAFVFPPEGLEFVATASLAPGAATAGGSLRWATPNTGNPPSNAYRLYALYLFGQPGMRLSTTTAEGYNNTKLAGLTVGTVFTLNVNGTDYTCTVQANDFEDVGTATERRDIRVTSTPTLVNTTLSDGVLTITSPTF